jgi:hypothetical protein
MEASDPGQPIAYQALASGTPVHDREGLKVGEVRSVLAVEEEDVFDGLVITTAHGTRFIDAPDIVHIAERRVDLKLTGAEVARQPEHEEGTPTYSLEASSGRWQDLWRRITLRRLWKRD